MVEINFTKNAVQKYKLLVNGIKKSIDIFLNNLKSGKIINEDLHDITPTDDDDKIFYKKVGDLHLIIAKTKNSWFILDFLTEEEIRKIIIK